MRKRSFSVYLRKEQERRQWTTAALAEFLTREIGAEVNKRTLENWLQGRATPLSLMRRAVEKALS